MFLFKLACFLEILLYLMIFATVIAVAYGVIYGICEMRERKVADPILYDDDNRALEFLAEVEIEGLNG